MVAVDIYGGNEEDAGRAPTPPLPGAVPDFESPVMDQRPHTAGARWRDVRGTGHVADSLPPPRPRSKHISTTTYNALGIVHKRGEIFALAHPHAKTGFKLTEGKKKLDCVSSYQDSFGRIMSPHAKQLLPYQPHAMRNRLPAPDLSPRNRRYAHRPSSGTCRSSPFSVSTMMPSAFGVGGVYRRSGNSSLCMAQPFLNTNTYVRTVHLP
ncbi:hypothetical protein DIPPA_04558 [Diplonema papillatum]|nr:hypothetical protein DIPPA_04558 [Diplonema papillatum]